MASKSKKPAKRALRARVKKPKVLGRGGISLHPLDFETGLSAALMTGPPPDLKRRAPVKKPVQKR
jgi:hypothetical protein